MRAKHTHMQRIIHRTSYIVQRNGTKPRADVCKCFRCIFVPVGGGMGFVGHLHCAARGTHYWGAHRKLVADGRAPPTFNIIYYILYIVFPDTQNADKHASLKFINLNARHAETFHIRWRGGALDDDRHSESGALNRMLYGF